jgi:hypothetical protein
MKFMHGTNPIFVSAAASLRRLPNRVVPLAVKGKKVRKSRMTPWIPRLAPFPPFALISTQTG